MDERFDQIAAELAATPKDLRGKAFWPALANVASNSRSGWIVVIATILFGQVQIGGGSARVEILDLIAKTGLSDEVIESLLAELEAVGFALRRGCLAVPDVTLPGLLAVLRAADGSTIRARRCTPVIRSSAAH